MLTSENEVQIANCQKSNIFKGKAAFMVFKAKTYIEKNWKLIRIDETRGLSVRSSVYKDVDWDPLPRCQPVFVGKK